MGFRSKSSTSMSHSSPKQSRAATHALLSFAFVLLWSTQPLLADFTQANTLLQQGRVQEATASLDATLAQRPADGPSRQLLCRIYYAQELADAAIRQCELAVSSAPDNSDNYMWLARAYGLKASKANPLKALTLAKKVHAGFERAIQINPENVHAMSDLGEYYVAAPAIVGGGLDKARTLAATMQSNFPAQAHRLFALIAEKEKYDATAEAEFKAAVAAGHTPDAYIDLGHFYERHNQKDKMLEALHAGIASDRRRDAALVDAASILTASRTSPELAEDLLHAYLSSNAKTDDAPAFKVHVQLGNLLAQNGDTAGARREYAAAFALAPNYAPAREAMQGS
jgi:tetratricopeptide (TPR) repeat protein